ncbi:MAG: 2,3,4,5-tetrahydropyridine-2,6-dicarboxylate N-acetyltransferase [Clostridia bacterium]
MDSYELIRFISESTKKTPVEVYIKGDLAKINLEGVKFFGNESFGTIFCELNQWEKLSEKYSDEIKDSVVKIDRRNSAIPLLDYKDVNARIEPGVIIRDMVEIGDGAVIMMGSVINLGARIGKKTMIDMNVVIGGRGAIGDNCHIGAGAVIAGVIEPPSADPVVIEDDVVVGANAVVLEGVRVGKGAVVAAGAIVTENVPENAVVAGTPARVIKMKDEKTALKTQLVESLRQLNKE